MTHQSAPSYSSSGGHFDVSTPNERRGGAAGSSPRGFRVFGTGSCQRRSEYSCILTSGRHFERHSIICILGDSVS